MHNSTQKNKLKVKIIQPHWPKNNIDPTKLFSIGDWAILQDLYSTLVEPAQHDTVSPGLAESWTESSDGKRWEFKLKKGLKWSDGSPMTVHEVEKSLKRAITDGTVHTELSEYVADIHSGGEDTIVFTLKNLPKSFLLSLALVDFSIVDQAAFADGGFSWSAKSSGPFRVTSFSNDQITLIANPYYWNHSEMDVAEAVIDRGMYSTSDLKLLENSSYDAAQLALSLISGPEDLAKLNDYAILTSSSDMNASLIFSKKRYTEGRMPDQLRKYLLYTIYEKFWEGDKSNPKRATGLRPQWTLGALESKEIDRIIGLLASTPAPSNGLSLDVVLFEDQLDLPITAKIKKILNSMGMRINYIVSPRSKFESIFLAGNYDLIFIYVGASEMEPDSAWRIFNKQHFMVSPASSAELAAAAIETDEVKRNNMYRIFETRALQTASYIPLKNEPTYMLTEKRVKLDKKQASDWGLQIYKLKRND